MSPDKYDGPDKRRGGGTYPNLLDAHSPFQIDGNFGRTAGVAEMLIQSTPGSISLLPALPQAWSTGSFKGLRTRTGHTVDACWRNGRVTSVTLTLPVDQAQTYIDAAPESVTLTANGRTRIVLLTDTPLTINLLIAVKTM